MHVLHKLEELTEKELLEIVDKGDMTKEDLDISMKGICLLTDITKLKVMLMENGLYDNHETDMVNRMINR